MGKRTPAAVAKEVDATRARLMNNIQMAKGQALRAVAPSVLFRRSWDRVEDSVRDRVSAVTENPRVSSLIDLATSVLNRRGQGSDRR